MSTHHRNGSGSGSFNALTRHDEYFLTGGDLYFLVEHVQFRVHRYFFERESPFFRGKLATPASPGAHRQGNSESTAIILDGVKPAEFARFLWVFYNPKYSIYNASVDDWSTILTLAHRWTFHEVKALAIRELQRLDSPDIDRIVLYHACEVDRNLLVPRYAALCMREDPLNLEEGMRLGLETTLMIARTREYARGSLLPSGGRSPIVASISTQEMVGLIRQLFGIVPPLEEPEMVVDTITFSANGAALAPTTTSVPTTNTTTTSAPPLSNGNANDGAKPNAKKHNNVNNESPVAQLPAPAPPATTTTNGNATPAPDAPPPKPPKNDTTTAPEPVLTGPESTAPEGKVERTQSNGNGNAANNATPDASKDGENGNLLGLKDDKGKKDGKDKENEKGKKNGGAPTLDTINTGTANNDPLDFLKDEVSGKQSPTPSRKGQKGGWLKPSVR